MISKADIKRIAALGSRKAREERGQFIIEGLRAVSEAVGADFEISFVIHTDDFAATSIGSSLLRDLRKKAGRVERVTPEQLAALSDTVNAQGVVAVVEDHRVQTDAILTDASAGGIVVALDAVSDPGNLGGIVRTCDWFGVHGILLGKGCVELLNPKVIRSTMGSVFHLPIARDVSLIQALNDARAAGYRILVTDTDGSPADSTRTESKVLVAFGNEAHGISPEIRALATDVIAIPKYGRAESLNVGVACGVLLSHLIIP